IVFLGLFHSVQKKYRERTFLRKLKNIGGGGETLEETEWNTLVLSGKETNSVQLMFNGYQFTNVKTLRSKSFSQQTLMYIKEQRTTKTTFSSISGLSPTEIRQLQE